MLKLVATTSTWLNHGTREMPMWRPAHPHEYIIARFDKEPTFQQIGEAINNFIHYIEGPLDDSTFEILSGHELYFEEQLTHAEGFQLEMGGAIDFPAKDISKVELPEFIKQLINEK